MDVCDEVSAPNQFKKAKKREGRSLTDEEYEEIFKAVLERYPPSPELTSKKSDDFETIEEDDFTSEYVEAFLSQKEEEKLKSAETNMPVLNHALPEENPNKTDETMDPSKDDDHDTNFKNSEDNINKNVKSTENTNSGIEDESREKIAQFNSPESEIVNQESENIEKVQGDKQENDQNELSSVEDIDKKKDDDDEDCKSSQRSQASQENESSQPAKKKRGRPKSQGFDVNKLSGVKSPRLMSPARTSTKLTSKSNIGSSKKQKMRERKIEETGTWVQCMVSSCMKWRYLEDVHDPSVLPEKWDCSMNTDENYNRCDKPEQSWDEEVHCKEFIFTKFAEGSVVWARMAGYPWWPGMVEIDPDQEKYFQCRDSKKNVATSYHVVFFDEKVSRAWIRAESMKSFDGEKSVGSTTTKGHNYKKAIAFASETAKEAQKLSLKERLQSYGFAERYKGRWGVDVFQSSQEPGPSQKPQTSKSQTNKSKPRTPKDKAKSEMALLEKIGVSKKTAEYLLKNQEDIVRRCGSMVDDFFASNYGSDESDGGSSQDFGNSKKKKKKLKRKQRDSSSDEYSGKHKKKSKKDCRDKESHKVKDTHRSQKSSDKSIHAKKQMETKVTSDENKNDVTSTSKNRNEQDTEKLENENKFHSSSQDDNASAAGEVSQSDKIIPKMTSEVNQSSEVASEINSVDNKSIKKKPAFPLPVKKRPKPFGAPVKKSVTSIVKAEHNSRKPGLNGDKHNKTDQQEKNNNFKVPKSFDSDVFTMEMSQGSDEKLSKTEASSAFNNSFEDEDEFIFQQSQVMNDIIRGVDISVKKDEANDKFQEKGRIEHESGKKQDDRNVSQKSDVFEAEEESDVKNIKENIDNAEAESIKTRSDEKEKNPSESLMISIKEDEANNRIGKKETNEKELSKNAEKKVERECNKTSSNNEEKIPSQSSDEFILENSEVKQKNAKHGLKDTNESIIPSQGSDLFDLEESEEEKKKVSAAEVTALTGEVNNNNNQNDSDFDFEE